MTLPKGYVPIPPPMEVPVNKGKKQKKMKTSDRGTLTVYNCDFCHTEFTTGYRITLKNVRQHFYDNPMRALICYNCRSSRLNCEVFYGY